MFSRLVFVAAVLLAVVAAQPVPESNIYPAPITEPSPSTIANQQQLAQELAQVGSQPLWTAEEQAALQQQLFEQQQIAMAQVQSGIPEPLRRPASTIPVSSSILTGYETPQVPFTQGVQSPFYEQQLAQIIHQQQQILANQASQLLQRDRRRDRA